MSQPVNAHHYRSIVGKLQYASIGTRPDISFAVGKVGRFNQRATTAHLTAAKRILRYLLGASDIGIVYKKGSLEDLCAYADSDHAGDPNTKKSTTGYVIEYAGGPISWRSKRQGCITLSTYEAELVALSRAISEIDWLCGTLGDIGVTVSKPIKIYCDNSAAVTTSNVEYVKPIMSRTVELRRHFIREKVQTGLVNVLKIAGTENVADALTKALARDAFLQARELMMG